ncbi:hypothetical protein [Deinococcus sp. 6GRE01]|uniref:hypothetical protein n=1 Tax=Deinococcus sp. 6GRE01 TaxID=2745873 RepID=UPI001E6259C6|nr:hypothetical protein [Deinococcus sp. 6GRE01]MCD0156026.1 hypothetical protein [Deinococcus sp. 6GRE01]
MNESQALAKSVLQLHDDISQVIEQLKAEPAWLVKDHLVEPLRSSFTNFQRVMTKLEGHLKQLREGLAVDLAKVRDGEIKPEDLRPEFVEMMSEMLDSGQESREAFLEALALARTLRGERSTEGAGSALN